MRKWQQAVEPLGDTGTREGTTVIAFGKNWRGRRRPGWVGMALALLALASCGPGPKAPAPTPIVPLAQLPNYVPHGTPQSAGLANSPTPPPRVTPAPSPAVSSSSRSLIVPTPVDDARFGVVFDGLQPDAAGHALRVLHVQWFDGEGTGLEPHPRRQIQVVPADLTQLAALARQYPGRVWSIHAEPNGISVKDPNAAPAAYAARLHAVATTLHAADPTARLMGPDVIDWLAGCVGCGGMTTGQAWTEAMRQAYLTAYQQEVPFDIWSIHTYPLDWQRLPTVDYALMEQQLLGFRAWLDSVPDLRGKPIWDTELGIHWGYTAYAFAPVNGKLTLVPAGILRTDLVETYLRQFLAWLVANGPRYHIERWFVFAAYNPDDPGDHAGAISLLDGAGPDGRLTPFGRIFVAAQQ